MVPTLNSLTQTENNHLRRLIRTAVDSGDFTSYSDLGTKANLGSTTLYPFMRKENGLSRPTAERLYPFVEKYKVPREERANLHLNGHGANGHSNGVIETGTKKGHAKTNTTVALFKTVLAELLEYNDGSTDHDLQERIEAVLRNWCVQGLDVLATAAKQHG